MKKFLFFVLYLINFGSASFLREESSPKIKCHNDTICRKSINCQDGVTICKCNKLGYCVFD